MPETETQVEEMVPHILPKGTRLRLSTAPGILAIWIEHIPPNYDGTITGALEGGMLIFKERALASFGSLVLSGRAVIGTPASGADLTPFMGGSYQINGPTATSWLGFGRRKLQSGDLRSGAQLFFCRPTNPDSPRILRMFQDRDARCRPEVGGTGEEEGAAPMNIPAGEARLQISIPDAATPQVRVTAISDYAPVDLVLLYHGTEPVVIRPNIIDYLTTDPVMILFGALGGSWTIVQVLLGFANRKGKDDAA